MAFPILYRLYVLAKRKLPVRPSPAEGKLGKRTPLVRKFILEVVGFVPDEKRTSELLNVGKDKRALKVAKRKLGTHLRAKKKCEEMPAVLREMR